MKNLLFSCCLLTTAFFVDAQVVPIPDPNFLFALQANGVDKNFDGIIELTEAQNAKKLNLSERRISDLSGIEYFTSLTYLHCGLNNLSYLDISKNTALDTLNCIANLISKLKVSTNTKLKFLNCNYNKIDSLDVSKNTELTHLDFGYNTIKTIDLSKNPKLEMFNCQANQLEVLDVSFNPLMYRIDCQSNKLKYLNVSQNKVLGALFCSSNRLTFMDVSTNKELTALHTDNNPDLEKTCIDSSQSVAASFWPKDAKTVWSFDCSIDDTIFMPDPKFKAALLSHKPVVDKNGDKKIQISEALVVSQLDLSHKSITDLTGINYFVSLAILDCNFNPNIQLDLSKNKDLIKLDVTFCKLTKIDVSKNTNLFVFYCDYNNITELDVTNNLKLNTIWCHDNDLKKLDVRNNTALNFLYTYNNPNLTTICITDDQMTKIETFGNYYKDATAAWNTTCDFVTGVSDDLLKSENKKIIRIITPLGIEISPEMATDGFYIFQYNDGSTQKIIKK